MGRYVVSRLIGVIPTILLLLFLVVVLVRLLPGNALDLLLQDSVRAKDATRTELEHRLGLDKTIPEEFVSYSLRAVRGDLGNSLWTRKPVTELIRTRIGVTLELSLIALVSAITLGMSVGIASAVMQNTVPDYLLRGISILGLSIPNFALATLVIVLPTLWFSWSPSVIYVPPSDGIVRHVTQFIIPGVVLGLSIGASLMRITRTMMLEVLRLDYIRTARAKGLGGRAVIFRHAVRNALIPVTSLLGVQAAFLLSGAVVTESVFALPGMGRALIEAISTRDYPLVQGIAMVAGLMVIFINLLVDLSYGLLDPRVKVG